MRPSAHLWSAPFPLAGCCPGGKSPAVARAVHCNQQRGELKATMRGALRESLRPPVRAASHLSESLGWWWLACTRSFCSRRAAPGRAHAPARGQCRPCSGLAGSRGFAELRTAARNPRQNQRPATRDPNRPGPPDPAGKFAKCPARSGHLSQWGFNIFFDCNICGPHRESANRTARVGRVAGSLGSRGAKTWRPGRGRGSLKK